MLGIPSILAIIIIGDGFNQVPFFSFFIGIMLLLGIKEIPILVKKMDGKPFLPILLIFIMILQVNRFSEITWKISIYDLLTWITMSTMIIEIFRKKETPFINICTIIFSFIWLGIMLGSLSTLRNIDIIGFHITLALFLSVWICDTAAFVFGTRFGKRKILPNISPNKTWVGTIVGLLSSITFMLIAYHYGFFPSMVTFMDICVLGLISGIFGQLGDFAESLLKREAKIKDSSNFLRGHGGILDRFDSLSFAAPLTLMYCNYFI